MRLPNPTAREAAVSPILQTIQADKIDPTASLETHGHGIDTIVFALTPTSPAATEACLNPCRSDEAGILMRTLDVGTRTADGYALPVNLHASGSWYVTDGPFRFDYHFSGSIRVQGALRSFLGFDARLVGPSHVPRAAERAAALVGQLLGAPALGTTDVRVRRADFAVDLRSTAKDPWCRSRILAALEFVSLPYWRTPTVHLTPHKGTDVTSGLTWGRSKTVQFRAYDKALQLSDSTASDSEQPRYRRATAAFERAELLRFERQYRPTDRSKQIPAATFPDKLSAALCMGQFAALRSQRVIVGSSEALYATIERLQAMGELSRLPALRLEASVRRAQNGSVSPLWSGFAPTESKATKKRLAEHGLFLADTHWPPHAIVDLTPVLALILAPWPA